MDAQVPYKRGQRRLRSAARASLLGDGLLVRARSTSLALLGITASVGLAMVALALNQSWPLIAGSSIPDVPPRHQGIGKATIVAAPSPGDLENMSPADRPRRSDATEAPGHHDRNGAPAVAPEPAGSAELVVAPSDPTGSPGGPPQRSPEPARPPEPQPQQAAAVQPAPAPSPPSPPAPTPEPVEPAPPGVTASEAPDGSEESYVPPWSHGKGHAYGRSDREFDVDD
jgi:hypothetical protein